MIYRTFLLVFLLTGLFSCRKEPDISQQPPAGGSWTIKGDTYFPAYSETDNRKGYQLNFASNSGVNSVSFHFRSRPVAAGIFLAASDTSKSSNISVHLVHNGIAYHSTLSSTNISIDMPEGKLFLKGARIRMSADSTSDADADLDFSLREY